MANNLDNYPEEVYSLCLVCKNYNECDKSFCLNRPTSSSVNVIPTYEYSCKQERFETSYKKPFKYECASFLEDRGKVDHYKKKYTRGKNKK